MFHCCHCATTIPTGLLCTPCLSGQTSSVFPVRFCNFCGGAMAAGRHGTECSACESKREARFARITAGIRKVSNKPVVPTEQQSLWAS